MRGKRCAAPPPRTDLEMAYEVTIDGHRYALRPGVELTVKQPPRFKAQRVKFRALVTNAKGHQWIDAWDGRMARSFQLAHVVRVHRTVKMGAS